MRVVVNRPRIDGDTVIFSWEQSEPNPYQYENGFYFRYEGIDLSQFTTDLFYEVFLGLQLRVFAHYEGPVEVHFPEPVSPYTVSFWRAFHRADQVEISPIATTGGYSPWRSESPPPPKRRWGALFGGGKDSTLATCLLRELYGADQTVIFQLAIPMRPGTKEQQRIEQRQERLMLQPAREQLGVTTHHAWTDYLAGHHKSKLQLRPHLELYTAGFLPAFLHWGVSLVTTSFPWSAFPYRRLEDGSLWFRYPRSRPEILADQSRHYARSLGTDLTLTNLNLLFTTFSAYRMLIERYPDPFSRIIMCVAAQPDQRWCYQCNKCAEYAIFGLANGIFDPRFDYNRLFRGSRYIQQIIEYIESGVERSVFGNVPWRTFVGTGTNYLIDCHAIAQVVPEAIADQLRPQALTNLLMLKAAFGNHRFPYAEQIPASAIDLLGNETARRAAQIAGNHFDIVDPIEGPFLAGDEPVDYDFRVRMIPETRQVEHLRP